MVNAWRWPLPGLLGLILWTCGSDCPNKDDPSRALVNKVAGAVAVYTSDYGPPATLVDLARVKLVKTRQLKDPWSTPLRYRRLFVATPVTICSAGADRLHFSDDDICND